MSDKYIIAIDQGTTSSRAIIFNHQRKGVGLHLEFYLTPAGFTGIVQQVTEDLHQIGLIAAEKSVGRALYLNLTAFILIDAAQRVADFFDYR